MSAEAIGSLIGIFTDIAVPGFSIAFTFGLGVKIVRSLLSMGLDGKFKL